MRFQVGLRALTESSKYVAFIANQLETPSQVSDYDLALCNDIRQMALDILYVLPMLACHFVCLPTCQPHSHEW